MYPYTRFFKKGKILYSPLYWIYQEEYIRGRAMEKKTWKGLLLLVAFIVVVLSAGSLLVGHSEIFAGFLYGAGGVALFMLLAKMMTLIQREGKQDD
ncbi:hypothetical protein C5S36_11340 [Candidatus Methanophagaceae archaeon]|jgi:hypothetical protein|nr:hypothetical protein C5S36_11340 [Methanophagales archaeon]